MRCITLGLIVCFPIATQAQTIPDSTLGQERSIVTSGAIGPQVEGGAIRASNLFHSFRELSVAPGSSLYFQNPIGITNIITRITGSRPSNIEGTLGITGGNANLFLLNPNGLLFGPNAKLDISGSFIGSTASAIQFGNQGFFSAATPEAPPLLTVNPSAFLFGSGAIGPIVNRSQMPLESPRLRQPETSLTFKKQGLKVADGQSLLLLGGAIDLDGGGLNAIEGRIELGAVSGPGIVGLSLLDNGWHFEIPRAIDRADITATNGATVTTSGEGGGPIQIFGRSIFVNRGAQILTSSQGSRSGGDLYVNASELLEVVGVKNFGNLSTLSLGNGLAGNLTIDTSRLVIKDSGQILAGTLGSNSAGQLTVNASESIEIVGRDSTNKNSSGLASFTGGSGQAGNILVNTKKIFVKDGGVITAEALPIFNQEDLGDGLPARGEGGNLIINASEILLVKEGFIAVSTQSPGNAGSIMISTTILLVKDRGEITATSAVEDRKKIGSTQKELGNAGNITIKARSIALTNQSQIAATTESSQGGNISISAPTYLLLRNGSTISTTAGTIGAPGNGGTITLNSNFLIAVPKEDSDITANAFTGNGGNINITTTSLLGLQPRQRPTPLSDITASSQFGLSGTLTLTTTTVPSPLPRPPVADLAPPRFFNPCSNLTAKKPSRFYYSGRGGLHVPPEDLANPDALITSLATASPSPDAPPLLAPEPPLIEAQGIQTLNGTIALVAPQTVAPQNVQCSHLKDKT